MNFDLTNEMMVRSRAHGHSSVKEQKPAPANGLDKKAFLLLESAPDATIMVNQSGMVSWANPKASTLLKYKNKELTSEQITVLMPEIHSALFPYDVHSFFKEPVEHRAGVNSKLSARCSDGSLIMVDVTFSPLNLVGKVYTWVAIREVPSRAESEEKSGKSQTYYRSLIETSLDPQVNKSPDGRITDVNEATVQVTGVSRERLIGTYFPDYFTEPRKAEEAYQQAFYK
jgi:PAS domain S-box-containing protein